ncbi:hypothetical protein HII31_12898 [Pseudocercospora fuligena]|uniref:Uncharacterized protein n=1 Tax=Pseudocercospora fuligena TaxID=685502 RepID=A0A8H6R973_9PEZI|nr:hypothetical protein HII31_12898 [Pseudocercospora fuligena]
MNKERRPPTVWGEYNRRWVNIHLMLRETYKPSSTRGAYAVMQHWFATKQPAYVHEALPWPVPGFDAYRVTADEARAFYKKAFVTHKYNVADEGEEGKLSAADMAYYRDVILIEKRRWWPLVEHLGGEKKLMAFADDKENVLKGVKPERVLLTVLRVLDEMGRKVEEPILKLDPDGGVYSLSKTWKEYLGCRLQ